MFVTHEANDIESLLTITMCAIFQDEPKVQVTLNSHQNDQ